LPNVQGIDVQLSSWLSGCAQYTVQWTLSLFFLSLLLLLNVIVNSLIQKG